MFRQWDVNILIDIWLAWGSKRTLRIRHLDYLSFNFIIKLCLLSILLQFLCHTFNAKLHDTVVGELSRESIVVQGIRKNRMSADYRVSTCPPENGRCRASIDQIIP